MSGRRSTPIASWPSRRGATGGRPAGRRARAPPPRRASRAARRGEREGVERTGHKEGESVTERTQPYLRKTFRIPTPGNKQRRAGGCGRTGAGRTTSYLIFIRFARRRRKGRADADLLRLLASDGCAFAPATASRREAAWPVTSAASAAHIGRHRIAAPGDVHVRPQQQQVEAVDLSRRVARRGRRPRRAARRFRRRRARNGALPRGRCGAAGQRVAAADQILHGPALSEPDMRQPRAGPGRRAVLDEIVLRRPRPAPRQRAASRRSDSRARRRSSRCSCAARAFAIAIRLARVASPLRRVVANVRAIGRAPGPAAGRGEARGGDVALADLPALGLVGGEQRRPAPALQRRRRASRRGRSRRRRRCSCRARRSG